ncbi:hypothetical protein BN1708_004602 [Verticillium longisporum]|uniref:Uncharacterized protein n=1 Tax=Verticillium longisporum TaxID=100787 RepID=A0A0G4M1J1_VERLO|nr:hypothetical protein BN1708_004602 [Verticillium longisporum]
MIYQASVLGFEGGHNTDVQHDSHKETEGSNERVNNEAPGFSSIALPKLVQLNQCSPRRRLSTWLVRPPDQTDDLASARQKVPNQYTMDDEI